MPADQRYVYPGREPGDVRSRSQSCARRRLPSCEHLVVQDLFLTETAAYADVVLPASAWPEKDGTVTNTNRQVQMGRAALPLPGEARADWWITQEIARRIGMNWNYTHPREIYARDGVADAVARQHQLGAGGARERRDLSFRCARSAGPRRGVRQGFPAARRIRQAGCRPRCSRRTSSPTSNYPFVLTTGRQLEHWHTGAMTRRASTLDALEPERGRFVSRGTIAKLGIKPGDMIRVSTRRGTVEFDRAAGRCDS